MNYLVSNRLVSPVQHGFVPRRACNTNLLETLDVITSGINEGFPVDVVFLDFAKAFDKVSHSKLLLKLESYGLGSILVNWVKAFLSNRRQRVVIGNHSSDWKWVLSGVPQGSVLGPILFVIFINDLPLGVRSVCKMYADDCKLINIIKNSGDSLILQEDINRVQVWANVWQATFNCNKCKVMHFGRDNQQYGYTMIDYVSYSPITLSKTDLEKDLGVLISSNLKWEHQVSKASNTANGILAQIRNSFSYLDTELVRLLYLALVRPHLEFAVSVWNPYLQQDIKKLESIQRRATKLSPNIKKMSYDVRLKEFRLTSLEIRRERGILIQFYKIINSLDEVKWLKEIRCWKDDITGKSTRNLRRDNRHFYREGTGRGARREREEFFINRVIPIWNGLPSDVKNANSLDGFKAALDRLEKFSAIGCHSTAFTNAVA